MKKRILSLLVAVMMLLSVCCAVQVSAEDAPVAVCEDFTASAVTGNLVTTYPTEGSLDINAGEVRAAASGTIATFSAVSACNGSNDWGLQGFEISKKFIPTLTGTGWAPNFTAGTKIAFSAKVRKAQDATANTRINVAFASWYPPATQYYPSAYPNAASGFDVTSTDWMDFNAVITIPANAGGQTWAMVFGFSTGTPTGAKVEVDMSSIYFGVEYAHDIKVEVSGSTNVEAGSGTVINADADILNQTGGKYSTQGTFNWYALDEARTETVPGITITPGAGGTATISVGASVPAGNYVIAAQSVENPQMVKSFTITVGVKDWSDHMPVTVNNIINTYPTEGNLDINDGNVSATASGEMATLAARSDSAGSSDHALQGFVINGKFISDLSADKAEIAISQGTKAIFKAKVRKAQDATHDAKINVAYSIPGSGNSSAWHYPDNYPTGFEVTSTDWMDFEATITARENIGGASYWEVLFGFYNGTTEGSKVEIDMTSLYFVPYKACDIKITDNTGTATLDPGIASSFTADIVDSEGNAMGGVESFDWALLNEDRTARVSGVTFTPDAQDVTTVDVVADNTVTPGNYYLVAESKAAGTLGWIKSIPVTVLKATINDYVAGTIPGAIDDITITRTDAGSQTMGLTDTAAFLATVVDSSDVLVSGEQDFVWFVMDETRKEIVTDEFTVVSSSDTTTATVTPKLTTANGTYYVMAQYADNAEIVRAIKIIIDKSQSVGDGANLINNGTSAEIGAQLSDLSEIVDVSAELRTAMSEASGTVKAETAEILATSFGGENLLATNDADAVKGAIEASIAIALYNKNPESVVLFDAEGKFEYGPELGLSDIDTNGVTLYNVFGTILSDEGRNALQNVLSEGGHTTIDGFYKKLKENIVLCGVKYPDEIGVSYLESVLTEKNLEAAGIDTPKYLARSDKSETHKNIARNTYTIDTLESALEAEPENGQGGTIGGGLTGGGSSGGGGGGYSAPIETTPTDKSSEESTTVDYPKFSDVSEEHWAYSDIYYLRERGIINGLDKDHFNPNGNITREQFAKILCAALGIKTTTANTSFADVENSAWYAPYISAILKKGIVTGVNNETFGVGENITRQDLCTMIYRAIDNENLAYTALGFTDDDSISEYARDAVAVLKGLEIVNGYEDGSFNPKGLCTRAEAAKIICKLLAQMEVLSK